MKMDMTIDKAMEIHDHIVTGFKRWGKQFSPGYSDFELYSAIVVIAENGNIGGPSAEEVTKLRRQLAACQNREKARQLRLESVPAELDVLPSPANE
jgi:hypothetical protein